MNDDDVPPFVCHNMGCGKQLNIDHVTLITTGHVRRFCTVECIAEGQKLHHEFIANLPWPPEK